MPKAFLWLGSREAFDVLDRFQEDHRLDVKAQATCRHDQEDWDDNRVDAVYGVSEQRIGLDLLERFGDVSVIKVHGSLTTNYKRWHTWYPGEVTSYEAIKDALAIARDDRGTREVLLDFATGGGAVRGVDTAAEMIKLVRAVKPVNGHTDSHAFSAGYWLMAACKQTSAARMAEVGSIGTLAIVGHYVNTEENMGVKYHVLREGEFKAIGNPYEELTDEKKAHLQKNLAETNMFFLEHVSLHRNLMMSDKGVWAEGQIFFARKGVQIGLIDRVATLDDLIGSGASANITGDNRSYEMKISAEKLAQIAAGADPKAVLTEAELKMYTEGLEAESEVPEVPVVSEEVPVVVEEDPAPAGTLATDLRDALRENGKLEAKLEAAEAKLVALQATLDKSAADAASLLIVAQAAVTNLQVATQQPKDAKGTVAEVLAQYNDLQGKMAKMFGIGQSSSQTPVEDSVNPAVAGYRQHTMSNR
ncbi:putative signal peptide peptidase SppA [compost metagenome]